MRKYNKTFALAILLSILGQLAIGAQNPDDTTSQPAYESFSNLSGQDGYTSPSSPYESFSKLPQDDYIYYNNYDYGCYPYYYNTYPGFYYNYGYPYYYSSPGYRNFHRFDRNEHHEFRGDRDGRGHRMISHGGEHHEGHGGGGHMGGHGEGHHEGHGGGHSGGRR